MSLKTLTDRVTANGAVIDAAIAKGIGAAPPVVVTGTTDAQLDVLENALASQDAKLQAAIDAAGAPAPGGDPAPPGIPGNKVVSITSVSPQGAPAGSTVSVTIKGAGLTGAEVVGTGGLSFANATVVDDSTVTVDVTVVAGTAPGNQSLGVQVDGAAFELPFATS